jgi:hypothetical protein
MKTKYADYSLDEVPELEETEFEFSVSSCRRFEDANDSGDIGDSISITLDITGDIATFD